MDPIVFTAVIIASMFHATWNGMVKKHSNKVTAISAILQKNYFKEVYIYNIDYDLKK